MSYASDSSDDGHSTDGSGSGAASLTVFSRVTSTADPKAVWERVSKLGAGSFGDVYKVVSAADKTVVAAAKIIRVSGSTTKAEKINLANEIDLMRRADHANITLFHDAYRAKSNLWIVMEFCEGGSVLDLYMALSEGLDEGVIAYICRESLRGLEYVHALPALHRDIKGGNILLTSDGQVKLADFGVSAHITSSAPKRQTISGTPYWMAPEVIEEGSEYDGRADVWSLGITAIEMADMEPPMSNIHPMRALVRIPKSDPPTLARHSGSKAFKSFLKTVLVKDPEERPTATQALKHSFVKKAKAKAAKKMLSRAVQHVLTDKKYKQQSTFTFAQHLADSPVPKRRAGRRFAGDSSDSSISPVSTWGEGEPGSFVNFRKLRQEAKAQEGSLATVPWQFSHSSSSAGSRRSRSRNTSGDSSSDGGWSTPDENTNTTNGGTTTGDDYGYGNYSYSKSNLTFQSATTAGATTATTAASATTATTNIGTPAGRGWMNRANLPSTPDTPMSGW